MRPCSTGCGTGSFTTSSCSCERGRAEEGLAVASAEEEDKPLQVAAKVLDAVGGVTGELCQRMRPGGRSRGGASRCGTAASRRVRRRHRRRALLRAWVHLLGWVE